MPRWLLACTLAIPLACTPKTDPGFSHGSYDDTGTDDTDTGSGGDCAPSLGTTTSEQTEYPGRGWAAEIRLPFTAGSCPIEDGLMNLQWVDEYGTTRTEDPMTVGYDDEDVYVEAYDDQTGEGSLFVSVLLPSEGYHFEFELWMKFSDGSESNHASGVVN